MQSRDRTKLDITYVTTLTFTVAYLGLESIVYATVEGYGAVTVCVVASDGAGSERVTVTLTNTPISTQGGHNI